MIQLTRRATFSASHYYWNEAWSAAENEHVFGKCANKNGHGHNYTIEVTVKGEPDAVTGFVVDLKALKDVIEEHVLSVYDHRHLNLEVPEFAKVVPTTENIAIAIWNRIEAGLLAHPTMKTAQLAAVRVFETSDIFAEYRGGKL